MHVEDAVNNDTVAKNGDVQDLSSGKKDGQQKEEGKGARWYGEIHTVKEVIGRKYARNRGVWNYEVIWEQDGSRSWIPLNDFVGEELWQEYDRKHPRGKTTNKVGLYLFEIPQTLVLSIQPQTSLPYKDKKKGTTPKSCGYGTSKRKSPDDEKGIPTVSIARLNAIDYSIFLYIHLFISHVTSQRGKASMFVSIYFCFALNLHYKQLTNSFSVLPL